MELQKVWKIIDKEFKGKSENGTICYYRSPDGKKCAIGCFISDSDYSESIESISVSGLLYDDQIDISNMPSQDIKVLSELQNFHDFELLQSAPLKEQKAALFNKFVQLTRKV